MRLHVMARYYFDTRDNERFISDDYGLELSGDDAARDEAARGLADLAKDVLPGSLRRQLSIEVRDEAKEPLLAARLTFEIARLR
jgi:hypothetical protein